MKLFPAILSLTLAACTPHEGSEPLRAEAGPFRIEARFSPDPPAPGRNTITLAIRDAAGAPVEGAAVRAAAQMPAMGTMPEMRAPAEVEPLGDGRYRAVLDLPMAGSWPLSLHVHTPAGEAGLELAFATGIPVRLASAGGEAGVAYYSCSMHPSVRSNDPGTCPICSMDLVPVTVEELRSGTVTVDAARRQSIGIVTGRVERKTVRPRVRTVGQVSVDETRVADVSLRIAGWIGEVFADYTGIAVEKGRPLFTLYAPELLSAQEELLASARHRRGGDRSPLLENARRRLRLWNLTEGQIRTIADSGRPLEYVPILSPAAGVVLEKNVVAGSAAPAGARLYRIADLSRVWVEADAYEGDLAAVREGQAAAVTLDHSPGGPFGGTVAWVAPTVDEHTRTGRLRVELDNPEGRLRPGMYATVAVELPAEEHLVVPEGAVVRAGETALAFLDVGEGRLRPQPIRVGRSLDEGIVVLDGLREGDVVVTSGTFLVAAESKLKLGVQKW